LLEKTENYSKLEMELKILAKAQNQAAMRFNQIDF
jgi:hypothetical protein